MLSQPSYHLPDLHNVVFRHRADDPGLVGVPGEVRDFGCVASMDKLVGRRNTIFIIMIPDDVPNNRESQIPKVQQASMRLTSSSGGPSSASSGDCSSPILLKTKKEKKT